MPIFSGRSFSNLAQLRMGCGFSQPGQPSVLGAGGLATLPRGDSSTVLDLVLEENPCETTIRTVPGY